jgi:cation diffusion facilitator CzcD-associated flavoprotein CzcO
MPQAAVVIVGAGNSGAEIATQLVEQGASFVAMSIRTPPPIVPRDPFGSPVQRTSMLLSLLPPGLADQIGRITSRLLLGDLSRYEMFSLTHPTRAEAYHVHAFRRRSRNRRSISLRAKARAARKCSRATSRRPRRNSSSPHAAK